MTYEYRPADREHYSAALTLDPQSERLTWTALPGQDSMVIRTPYGVDPADEPEALREPLNRLCPLLPEGRFHTLNPRIAVRYVSAEEKARAQGCRAEGEAWTYTVFPCVTDSGKGLCVIYIAGGRDSLSSPRCDVPMNLRVKVTPVKPRTPWAALFRRETPAAFFRVSFPDPCPENYRDGDLEYSVNERWRIPVTRRMMERGEFYVRTDRKPVLLTRNAGIRLT